VLQKLLTWLVIIIFGLWLINHPDQAATLAHNIAHAIATLAGAL
jgi:hypothetical protein